MVLDGFRLGKMGFQAHAMADLFLSNKYIGYSQLGRVIIVYRQVSFSFHLIHLPFSYHLPSSLHHFEFPVNHIVICQETEYDDPKVITRVGLCPGSLSENDVRGSDEVRQNLIKQSNLSRDNGKYSALLSTSG